jgi:hypothetical protein
LRYANFPFARNQLLKHLDFCGELTDRLVNDVPLEEMDVFGQQAVVGHFRNAVRANQGLDSDPTVWAWVEDEVHMNAAGIVFAAKKKKKQQKSKI